MLTNSSFRPILALALLLLSQASWAVTVLVAVASDFTKPMTEIAAAFEKATGHTAKLSFGSSGKAFAQIQSGAPFDLYLSASEKYPLELEKSGFAVSGSHFVYAIGKLVLWSATPGYVDGQGEILKTGDFKHIALADPSHAPYGVVAVEVMNSLGVLDKLRPLFVMGENISQTFQFVSTGNAELGFVGLAQVIDVNSGKASAPAHAPYLRPVGKASAPAHAPYLRPVGKASAPAHAPYLRPVGKIGSGSGWIIPDNLHSPFRQMAVLLKTGAENPAAHALADFLKSPPALAIIEKYGFGLPK